MLVARTRHAAEEERTVRKAAIASASEEMPSQSNTCFTVRVEKRKSGYTSRRGVVGRQAP